MSKIDYQELRENAESTIGILENIAGFEPSDIDGDTVELRFETDGGFDTGCDVSIVDQCQKTADVVRALLDERERNQQYIKSRDQENEDIALTVGKLRVELEAAKKRIAELKAEPVSQTYKLNQISGNSPVTPDGWIPVSERMPEPYEYVLVTDGFDGCEVMRVNTDGYWGPAKSLYPGSITHWMPLPAAPQQEAK
ncbi:TPA: ead/Ea22-like family protein [Escherichia coli]